jgi:hypothetical protein
METYAAIRTVLAVRAYQDQPIPPNTVRRIVEAGHLTGTRPLVTRRRLSLNRNFIGNGRSSWHPDFSVQLTVRTTGL